MTLDESPSIIAYFITCERDAQITNSKHLFSHSKNVFVCHQKLTSKTLLYIVDSKKPKNDENVFGIEFVGNEVKGQWFRNQK